MALGWKSHVEGTNAESDKAIEKFDRLHLPKLINQISCERMKKKMVELKKYWKCHIAYHIATITIQNK